MCQLKLLFSVMVFSCMSSTTSTSLGSIGSAVSSGASAVGNVSNTVSNVACEMTPTGILCPLSVRYGHMIQHTLPPKVNLRHCSFLLTTPHCCRQFCKPASGGNCDLATGACYCDSVNAGRPNVCGLLIGDDSGPLEMNDNDRGIINICRDKCQNNTSTGCKKAAAATDGIAGTVCVCYCSDSTTTTTTAATATTT